MRQLLGVLGGMVVGLLCAGVSAALLIPALPAPWRSEATVWTVAAAVIALCVGAGVALVRPRPR
ncbi:MAG: hypothetical protein AB7Q29_11415 [Vicinamibacterales bacterium]